MGYKIDLYSVPISRDLDSVLKKWNNGNDFKIVGGCYCSIRNFDELRRTFDIINLKYVDKDDKLRYHNIWTNPLAGITTYI